MGSPTNGDVIESLEVIWNALFEYRDECIPEGGTITGGTTPQETEEINRMRLENDELWSDITTAMAWITEALGLEISTADDATNGEYVNSEVE